jgi:hypothetical protein
MSTIENQIKTLRTFLVLSWVVVLAVGAIAIVAIRKSDEGNARFDRRTLNALTSALYQAEHPQPQGDANDPAVELYFANYAEFRNRVVARFDSAMAE